MEISFNINSQKNLNKTSLQSFSSAYIARYYMENAEGNFYKIKDREIVKEIQKKIIRWINRLEKKGNSKDRIASKYKTDTPIIEKLASLLYSQDTNYTGCNHACSAHLRGALQQLISYIFTGRQAVIAENIGRAFGRSKSQYITQRTNSTYYENIQKLVNQLGNKLRTIDIFVKKEIKNGNLTYKIIDANG